MTATVLCITRRALIPRAVPDAWCGRVSLAPACIAPQIHSANIPRRLAPPSCRPKVLFVLPRAADCSHVRFEEAWSACRSLAFPAVTPRPATGGPILKTSNHRASQITE